MAVPAADQGFQTATLCDKTTRSHVITRLGVSRPPWMVGKLQADSGSEDNSSVTMDLSLKKEVTEAPSTSAWERSTPVNGSLNRYEDSALAQQVRKAAFMYGTPLQTLRANVARMSASADEAQLGAHQSNTDQPSSSHNAGTSGATPVPLYRMIKGNSRFDNGVQSSLHQQQQRPIQTANVAAAHASGTGKHPNTAQLTIFYAGMVNVYDDVPFDKAQAIMLLAGTGNAWNPNYTNFLGSGSANPGRPFSTPGGMHRPMSRGGSPAPSPGGSPTRISTTKLPARQVTTAVELPQARKASLARFLEKRKDRVRKGPYTHPNEAARIHPSRENSPSNPQSSSQPTLRRSLSPPSAGNTSNNNSGEPSSQPQTPLRQSISEDRSHDILARQGCESSNVDAMVARGEKSSPSR